MGTILPEPSPCEWRRSSKCVPPDRPRGAVDVIVPVYGAADELARCIASLEAHTDWERHRLVLVLDGTPEPAVVQSVSSLAERLGEGVLVLNNRKRQGFVVSANRGLAQSERDAVLLNSDTEVTSGWLDRLQAAAYSAPEVATATPFSNNATICSLPRGAEENTLPTGLDVDAMGRLVERVSQRTYPRLPTGVGVCLYVKRKVLEQVGLLDEDAFGLGYGEESELCFRALKAGYVHVLDDATFVYHAGQRSFGRDRTARVQKAHRRMRRLHPEYWPTIARFLKEDPLSSERGRVVSALSPPIRQPSPPVRVLHVVHGWPPYNHAGTEHYCRWLAQRQADRREVIVYSRFADPDRDSGSAVELLDGGIRVRLVVNHFDQRSPLARNALRNRRIEKDFARLLRQARPDLVHLHHLAGHSLGLARLVTAEGLPYVFQLQDWWMLCARANLLHRSGQLCPGPSLARCSSCLPLTAKPPKSLWNPMLYAFRNRLARRVLRRADAVVAGSEYIVESYRRQGLLRNRQVDILSYGVDLADRPKPNRRPPGRPLRFGYVGSLMPHKGVHLAVSAFKGVDANKAILELWGDPDASPSYSAKLHELARSAPVKFRGRFDEAVKAELLASLDALLVPSIGLESFGLVAREALAVGTPILVSRRSALAELVNRGMVGFAFSPDAPEELGALVRRLIADPHQLTKLAGRPTMVKGMDAHCEEIDSIYRRVLSGAAD